MKRDGFLNIVLHISILTAMVTAGFAGLTVLQDQGDGGAGGAVIYVDAGGGGNYTTIQDAVDNASAGDTIYVWDGYYTENVIVNKTLTIHGNGTATTKVDAGAELAGFVVLADWVNITNFHIMNSTWGGVHYAGIYIHHSDHTIVHDCYFTDNREGIRMVGSSHGNFNNNTMIENNAGIAMVDGSNFNKVKDNNCSWNFDYGIYAIDSNNNTIGSNVCNNNTDGGIYLSGYSGDSLVEKNVCNGNHGGIWVLHNEAWINNTVVRENTCNHNPEAGIFLRYNLGTTVQDNSCSGNGDGIFLTYTHADLLGNDFTWNDAGGIRWVYGSWSDIDGNNCSHNTQGMHLYGVHVLDIVENTVKGNDDWGIHLFDSEDNLIRINVVNNNHNGIRLAGGSKDNVLRANTVSHNNMTAVDIVASPKNTIENNVIHDNNVGIKLQEGSHLSRVLNNTVSYDPDAGILAHLSHHHVFHNNTVTYSVYGFYLVDSNHNNFTWNTIAHNHNGTRLLESFWNVFDNNSIAYNSVAGMNHTNCNNNTAFHNNFLSNGVQAVDTGQNNDWDNGAGEGNYWSDYNGVDNGSGNRTQGDGIGDTLIPHLGLDNYPFTNQSGWLSPGAAIMAPPGVPDTAGGFVISWEAAPRAIGYRLQEDDTPGFTSPETIYDGPETSYKVTGKEEGDYYYRVRSYNDNAHSPWSAIVKVELDLPPTVPSGFTAAPIPEGNGVLVSWDAGGPDVAGYVLEHAVKGTASWEVTGEFTPAAGEYKHTGLTDGITYVYRIRALDGTGLHSDYSAEVEATPADSLAPSPPGGVRVEEPTCICLTILWEESGDDDVTGYNVYRSLSENGPYEKVTDSPTNETSYVDFGLDETTRYHYAVTALDEVPNESELSVNASEKTILGPRAPVVAAHPGDVTIAEDGSDSTSIDLSAWFSDPNGDELTFVASGGEHISAAILRGGDRVLLTPETDWSGSETLTFTATDGVLATSDDVTVTVTPVNDPPGPAVITEPSGDTIIDEGDAIDLKGECPDPDLDYGGELTFAWSSDVSGHIGEGEVVEGVVLPAGDHTITLVCTDSSSLASSAQVAVTVTPSKDPDVVLPDVKASDFGLAISILEDQELRQGGIALLTLNVTNNGLRTDRFAVSLETGELGGQLYVAGYGGDAAPGETVIFALYVEILDATAVGDYDVDVTVKSIKAGENGFSVEDTMSFGVKVLEKQDVGGTPPNSAPSSDGPWDGPVLPIALGAGVLLAATAPWWYLGLLFLFAPLMVRLRKGDDEKKWRDKIFYTIASKPGIHFTGIKGWLDISNGTLVYNLEVLMKDGKIVSRRDGFFKRYYPVESELDLKPKDSMTMEERIAVVVRDNPGAAQSEISHVLDEGWSKVHYHVQKMEAKDILRAEPNRDGHPRFYLTEGKKGEEMRQRVFGKTITGEERGRSGDEVGVD